VTFSLLIMFVLVHMAVQLTGGPASRLVQDGQQVNALIEAGEWWRVVTATLLHSGLPHLLFNGYALYVLGAQLERGVGSGPFAALYVASGLAGGVAYLIGSAELPAVGASGAIFGLFGAWFAAAWVSRDTPQGRAGVSQLGLLLLINMALPLFLPNIGWQAHVGGLVAGSVIGLGWARRNRRGRATRASRLALPAAIAGVLFLGLLWYTLA
jgi:membrane associated rhomboid family serine protease